MKKLTVAAVLIFLAIGCQKEIKEASSQPVKQMLPPSQVLPASA